MAASPHTTRDELSRHAVLRRLSRSAGVLLSGNLTSAAIGLAVMAILVRTLGAAEYGVLVLIQAFAALVGEVVTLQAWQAIIRYGGPALAQQRHQELRDILCFVLRMDLAVCAVGATLAVVCVQVASTWFAWPSAVRWLASLYCLTVLLKLSSTPIAVFHLFDRRAVLARLMAVSACVRLGAVALAAAVAPTLVALTLATLAAAVFSQLIQLVCARSILAERGIPVSLRSVLRPGRSRLPASLRRRLVGSTVHSSMTGTLRTVSTHLVTILVGAVLGTVAVTQYRIIHTLGQMIARLTGPLIPIALPEFVSAIRRGRFATVRRITRAINRAILLLTIAASLAFWLAGEWMLGTFFGAEFTTLFWPMLAFFVLTLMGLCNTILIPLLWALDRHRQALLLQAAASAVHLGSLLLLAPTAGIPGVVLSYLVYQLALLGLGRFLLARSYQSVAGVKPRESDLTPRAPAAHAAASLPAA